MKKKTEGQRKSLLLNKRLLAYMSALGALAATESDLQAIPLQDSNVVAFSGNTMVSPGNTFDIDIDGAGGEGAKFRITFNDNRATNTYSGSAKLGIDNLASSASWLGSNGEVSFVTPATGDVKVQMSFEGLASGSDSRNMYINKRTSGQTYKTGNFDDNTSKYLGIKFVAAGNTHYGWVHVQTNSGFTSVAIDAWAYETTPNMTIVIGEAYTPSITVTNTDEDTQSTSGLVVTQNFANTIGGNATYLKISTITGGNVYKSDGITLINNNDFITLAEGGAGLRFTPSANSIASGNFNVQASSSADDNGVTSTPTSVLVTINPIADTPSVADTTTDEDTQSSSGLVISRNAGDGAEVTHFQITGISGGTLYQANGTTAIVDNDFITYTQANAGLKFTPTADSISSGSFNVQASTSNIVGGLGGSIVTATIAINPIADTPSITGATSIEDTQTGTGLVVSKSGVDGAEVTHFQITNISSGVLYQNDGFTAINDGDFITYAQANAGLKFSPTANFSGTTTLSVQASTSNAVSGLGGSVANATIVISAVADTPSVTAANTSEDTQSTSGLVISRNANDGVEVTHFQITGITGGTLYKFDGSTAIADNDFITYAEGNAGLKFTPTANSIANGSFNIQSSLSAAVGGLGGSTVAAAITVNPVADTPSVTGASTSEDTQSSSGLVISRNANDGVEVTHFQITGITGGTLYKFDGSTAIANNDFITYAEGNAGLKFTPTANSTTAGSFNAQASTSNLVGGLGGSVANAAIVISAVADTPTVVNASTSEDTQSTSGLVISRNANDGVEVTHFQITGITGGTLYKFDGSTAIADNDFITYAEGNAGLKFTPTANSIASGSFNIQASLSAAAGGLGGGTAAATITVNPVADTPSVTGASTSEDTQSSSGLVISRNVNDGSEITHFQITGITGGTLYQADGTTTIADNDFITYSQGDAGLKFTPTANSNASGGFSIQSSSSNASPGLGGNLAVATITVSAVADTPSVTTASTNEDTQTSSGLVISPNSVDSTEVTHFKVTSITGGSLYLNNGSTKVFDGDFITSANGAMGLRFTPTANSTTSGSFNIQASLSSLDAGLGGALVAANISVFPIADTPSVTSASTLEDTQSSSGLVITPSGQDGAEVTHFQISGITGGTLFQNDGSTAIGDGDFITLSEGAAGLKFTPSADSLVSGSLTVQASLSNLVGGLGGNPVVTSVSINPVADTPSITNATTNEDTQSSSGLVISRNLADSTEVTHFKVTGIHGGSLYQNDGSTPIAEGEFITFAQGSAGLKFTPTPDSSGQIDFSIQASISSNDTGLGGGTASASVDVSPLADLPSITLASTWMDTQTQSGLVISKNANDGSEITHYKISGITNGTLFKNDGLSQIAEGSFITVAEGLSGLKFSPAASFAGNAFFDVQASISNTGSNLGLLTTTTIPVDALPSLPLASGAITTPSVANTSGLVITAQPSDAGIVNYFYISNIAGGQLFLNDGQTLIGESSYILPTEADLGLKFIPSSTASGSFDVQAAVAQDLSSLSSATTVDIEVVPLLSLSAASSLIREGDQGLLAITLSLSHASSQNLSIPIETSGFNRNITLSGDNLSISSTGWSLEIPAGLTQVILDLSVENNQVFDGPQSGLLSINTGAGFIASEGLSLQIEDSEDAFNAVVFPDKISLNQTAPFVFTHAVGGLSFSATSAIISVESSGIKALESGNVEVTIEDESGQKVIRHIEVVPASLNQVEYSIPAYESGEDYLHASFPFYSKSSAELTTALQPELGEMNDTNYTLWGVGDPSEPTLYSLIDEGGVEVSEGSAFWFGSIEAKQVTVKADGPSFGEVISKNLKKGWNMVGNPYGQSMDVSQIYLVQGEELISVKSEKQTLLGHHFWHYDRTLPDYLSLSVASAGQGAWLWAEEDTSIYFMPNTSATLSKARLQGTLAKDLDLSHEPLPPSPPGLSRSSSSASAGGGCFIQTSAEPRSQK